MNLKLALLPLLHYAFCHALPEDFEIPHPLEINHFYQEASDVNVQRDTAPLSHVNPPPTLEDTIKEVEGLIKANPKLPRLTRGEIIDILENITNTDVLQVKNLTRANGGRAVMVVMPFTAGSAQEDIKELYTRAPVTHIIGEELPIKLEPNQRKKPSRRKPPSFPKIEIDDTEEANFIQQPGNYVNTFTTTTENISPLKVDNLNTNFVPTVPSYDVTTQKPVPTSAKIHSQKYTNHRYPDDDLVTSAPNIGIHVINPPSLEYSKPYIVRFQDLQRKPEEPEVIQTTQATVLDEMNFPDDFKSVAQDIEALHKPNFNQINVILQKPPTETPFRPLPIITIPTTTIKSIPGVAVVADHLTPEMKDLLQNFGLLENPNAKPQTEIEVPVESEIFGQNAEIKPESYMGFKPLPDDAPARQEMDDFLAKFGLGRKLGRSQKSMAMDTPAKELEKQHQEKKSKPNINVDVVPQQYKGVMQDLGFTTKNIKTMQQDNQITSDLKHVFNPSAQKNNTEEEMGRLKKLLNIIKNLDKRNSNLTEEHLKNVDVNVLVDLIESFNRQNFVPLDVQSGPNPLNYDYKILKNDVKRQEDTTTTSTTTTTESARNPFQEDLDTTITTMSTESARNPSLEDLEASFGGFPDIQVMTTTETPTTTRRSGFYYLVDWNTFLDIDDQNGKRVNLRFQPKIGDPRNFRYVTVP